MEGGISVWAFRATLHLHGGLLAIMEDMGQSLTNLLWIMIGARGF